MNIEGKRKVLHLVNFKDEDMKEVVDSINVEYELNGKYGWQDEIMKEEQDKQNKQDKEKEASALWVKWNEQNKGTKLFTARYPKTIW